MACVISALTACSTGPAACMAAGGTCVVGGLEGCRHAIPSGTVDPDFDCNPDHNPGGAVCCMPCDGGCS